MTPKQKADLALKEIKQRSDLNRALKKIGVSVKRKSRMRPTQEELETTKPDAHFQLNPDVVNNLLAEIKALTEKRKKK